MRRMHIPAPAKIIELNERFRLQRDEYLSGTYKEAQLRSEFIDPFFRELGWDMYNESGCAEAYKDVIHEDSIKISASPEAPDYCFRIGGTRKFFLEAKKPSIDIKHETHPAYQLRRYAWSSKLPLSILTDFEEFAVYDCRIKPSSTDDAKIARIRYYIFDQYPNIWDDIASIFSKAAVLKGSFDRFAESVKLKRGTSEVDSAFLGEIEGWRDLLARNIAIRNPSLSCRELNFAVQRTIDRIIFLRICEDRSIEEYRSLMALLNGANVYPRLCEMLHRADQRYNSGLFHFRHEKGEAEPPDELTPGLVIDDKPLKDIIRRLYYPDSPYEFSVLPADILGQVYEQFLGKVIRLTEGHRAVVEDKPEVKKAGGVYYTPTYIVDYIVRNTVGALLDGKTPVEAASLKILDPACGSGSFLIGAYQYLLDWHLKYYTEHSPEKWAAGRKPRLFRVSDRDWRLTPDERKRILLNTIFGVDIDTQAVEVTKLSLLLKVLEGETRQSLDAQLKLFRERALPDLGANIKCGNSLIGPDFFSHGTQIDMFDEEERYRINVFDWEKEFPEIMKRGGFDAVIGNPPYIFTRNQRIDELQKAYFYAHYKQQSTQLNTFGIFFERCHALMHLESILGFITPNNWLTIDSFAPLRRFLLQESSDIKIVNILDRVFAVANVDTAIVISRKGEPTGITISEMRDGREIFSNQVSKSAFKPPAYIITISLLKDVKSQEFLERIESHSLPLAQFCIVSTGLKAYQTGKGKPPQTDKEKKDRIFHSTIKLNETYGCYLDGVDVSRYHLSWSGEYLSYGDWLAEPRISVPFSGDRLLVRQIPSKPPYLVHGVFTDEPFYNDINSMVIFSPAEDVSLKYLLGLINSWLLSCWFCRRFDKLQRRIFPQFKVKELASFPIRSIDFTSPPDVACHDRMVSLVTSMLDLHRQLAAARTADEKTALKRMIDSTDHEIDRLVYELYELTDEEIRIVEAP